MKLFIDANIYLDFYEIQEVSTLLKPLIEVSDHVLVTNQIVDEVFRNKLEKSNNKFVEYLHKINTALPLPDMLTANAVAEIDDGVMKNLEELSSALKSIKIRLENIYCKTLEQIAKNEDKVSVELMKIFSTALIYSEQQINAANKRKMFGNPPGKYKNPVGDEISWQQVLDYAKENNCPIWVVSKDGDFMLKAFNKSSIGNAFLIKEIREKGIPDFKFYSNLSTALQEFKKTIKRDLVLPPNAELLAATEAQERVQMHQNVSNCVHAHKMEVIRKNGVFDIWQCSICGVQYMAYSDDCCS